MSKALVVLSGGQDSTTVLFMAKAAHEEVFAVTFDYNQRHRLEIESAKKVAELAGVTAHEIITLGPILQGRSFLTDQNASVDKFHTYDQMSRSNASKEDKLDTSFVPMRNPLFLTIATNRASVLGCSALYTGITAADFVEYGGFSWEWLGGFFDAEGCFSTINGNGWRMSFTQKDPELMQRIGSWMKSQIPELTFGFHVSCGIAEITIGKTHGQSVLEFLSPHLHSPHRRSQAFARGAGLKTEGPLTDAYITGFWEGDGSCWGNEQLIRKKYLTHHFHFDFFQKDPEVLEKICDYLGKGYLYQRNTQNQIWVLNVSDGPQSAKLLRRMQPHMNVLNSFAKIAKVRHKIGMNAGGFNPPYPDCTPDYLFHQQQTIDESLKAPSNERIEIVAPLLYLTKAQSIWLAQETPGAMEALSFSHTCYSGVYPPCGECHACLLRAYGFEQAGVADPLVQRSIHDH